MRVGPNNSPVVLFQYGTVERTDVVGVPLFTLPVGALPLSIAVVPTGTGVASDAGTAEVRIGYDGEDDYLGVVDVTESGFQLCNGEGMVEYWTRLNEPITAIYEEGGAASTEGGPWYVILLYVMVD